MQDPPLEPSEHWKDTKLSLERPYKNDQGQLLPTLFDITPEGELIYEPKESPAKVLGDNLRRIFQERGSDFFEKNETGFLETGVLNSEPLTTQDRDESESGAKGEETDEMTVKPMTVEELFNMRMEIMPQLYIALGEMSHARDLLSLLLSSASSGSNPMPPTSAADLQNQNLNTLSATIVDKPPAITPLQAFNAQLAIGGKDEALRKAAGLFKAAAERMERGRLRSEHYWVDALKIRRANWGLIPAPLPLGAPTGKGADKTTKDFMISYGLEESPPNFRRRAIAQMSYTADKTNALLFLHRQNTRLRISVVSTKADGSRTGACNSHQNRQEGETDLNKTLRTAQREVIEQEIFAQITKEAGSLPTASARVSERLILIDAAQNTELKFELVDTDESEVAEDQDPLSKAKCDFVYFYLLALLLRRHTFNKRSRLGMELSKSYQVFCRRIKAELDTVCSILTRAGIPTALRFNAVEDIGKDLVKLATDPAYRPIGGETTLRVDDRRQADSGGLQSYTIRLTMLSPSSLTVHLSQASISILSIPELGKLLSDEVEKIVLERICGLGRQICNDIGGVWFVDTNRCVGRWDGCAFTFNDILEIFTSSKASTLS
ncbi:hypothetical protein L218DRAFT_940755 [Marasmius fiardii PR-910]|nr:hypothetical protein L218DRAFT_940755 [Marasmius fiardii PR-910]